MAVTANIAVCAIRRSNDKKRIALYRSVLPVDGIFGRATIDISRENLISDVSAGKQVVTVFQKSGKWVLVAVIRLTSTGYLRTEQDDIPEDNLGNLS